MERDKHKGETKEMWPEYIREWTCLVQVDLYHKAQNMMN